MPIVRHDRDTLKVGAYYANVQGGTMIEIMAVERSGNCRVLDVAADLDAPWQPLSHEEISSCDWRLVSSPAELSPAA